MLNNSHCSTGGPGWPVIFPLVEGIDIIEQLSCNFYCLILDLPLPILVIRCIFLSSDKETNTLVLLSFSAVTNLIDREHGGTDIFQTSVTVLQ